MGQVGTLSAQLNIFWWVLVGSVILSNNNMVKKSVSIFHCCDVSRITSTLSQCWEIFQKKNNNVNDISLKHILELIRGVVSFASLLKFVLRLIWENVFRR